MSDKLVERNGSDPVLTLSVQSGDESTFLL